MFGAIFSGKSAPEVVVWRPLHFVSAPNPHPLPSSVVREDEPLLVASARAGDAAAFEELVARYEDKIFRLTSNITGNREDAEDAMQDAFLKAFTPRWFPRRIPFLHLACADCSQRGTDAPP